MILNSLETLQSSDSLLLIGYPLLTQVNVGVFFILVNMFLKVFVYNVTTIFEFHSYGIKINMICKCRIL